LEIEYASTLKKRNYGKNKNKKKEKKNEILRSCDAEFKHRFRPRPDNPTDVQLRRVVVAYGTMSAATAG
jgi:hypothetical protein